MMFFVASTKKLSRDAIYILDIVSNPVILIYSSNHVYFKLPYYWHNNLSIWLDIKQTLIEWMLSK